MVRHVDPGEEHGSGDGVPGDGARALPDEGDDVVKHPGEDLLLQPLHLALLAADDRVVTRHPVLHADPAPALEARGQPLVSLVLATVLTCLTLLPEIIDIGK